MATKIEWSDETWNPLVGCTHISPGCDHCYSAREASGRLSGIPVYAGLAKGGVFTGEVRTLPERLDQPLHWRKPRMVFVNSMSDLFHADVPYRFIRDVFNVMRTCNGMETAGGKKMPSHTFQVLTKRSQRMRDCSLNRELGYDPDNPPANVWLGVSIESDRYAFRADHLRDTAAAVRFLSCEPLIGPLPSLDLTGIDWVIVGAESGPGARPMQLEWAHDIVARCRYGVPCDACGGSGSIPAYGGEPGGQACECQYGPHPGRNPIPVFVKQLSSGGPRPIKDLARFPEALRIREYPTIGATDGE